jgi:hypothetical protein
VAAGILALFLWGLLMPQLRAEDTPCKESLSVKIADRRDSGYEAYEIERIKTEVPYFPDKAKAIPDDETVPPSEYLLRFRDKDGKTLPDF